MTEKASGVALSKLSASFIDDSDDPFDLSKIIIGGEACLSESPGIHSELPHADGAKVTAVVYDKYNRVVAVGGEAIGLGETGFDVFLIEIEGWYPEVSKIRIFVTR
jgi:hypothetical protein